MTCTHCEKAQTVASWAGFTARCRGCTIRALANGPAFFQALQAKDVTPIYKDALIKLLGEDWQASHEEVKTEFKRLKALKGKA